MGKCRTTIRFSNYHSKCLEYISTKLGTTENAVIQFAFDDFINNTLLEMEIKVLLCEIATKDFEEGEMLQ